jgi:hypothetical protein
LQGRAPTPHCWWVAEAITLPQHESRPEASARNAGPLQEHRGLFEVMSISFLPTTFTTLFALAVSLLLGLI